MSRIEKYKGFLAERGKLDVPEKIGAGIAYRITPCITAAFDVEYIHWEGVRSLSNNFPNEERLGGKLGSGFGFKDQWYYRTGIEWKITESIAARIGFRHANTPIKRSQTAVNVLSLDCVEDFITVGGTYAFNPCNEFSIVYAYGFEKTIKGKHSVPASFGGGEVNIHEQKYALAIAWGAKF